MNRKCAICHRALPAERTGRPQVMGLSINFSYSEHGWKGHGTIDKYDFCEEVCIRCFNRVDRLFNDFLMELDEM